MESALFKTAINYGFPAILSIVMIIGMFSIVKCILGQNDKREQSLLKIIEDYRKALESHSTIAQDFHKDMKNACEYQRDEHHRMIEILDAIKTTIIKLNGYRN